MADGENPARDSSLACSGPEVVDNWMSRSLVRQGLARDPVIRALNNSPESDQGTRLQNSCASGKRDRGMISEGRV